jgi:hypothetical protein
MRPSSNVSYVTNLNSELIGFFLLVGLIARG